MGNNLDKKILHLPTLWDWSVDFDYQRQKVLLSGYVMVNNQKTESYVNKEDVAHVRKIWRSHKCFVVQLENADVYRLEFKHGIADLFDRYGNHNILIYKKIFDQYNQYVVIEGSFEFNTYDIACKEDKEKIRRAHSISQSYSPSLINL